MCMENGHCHLCSYKNCRLSDWRVTHTTLNTILHQSTCRQRKNKATLCLIYATSLGILLVLYLIKALHEQYFTYKVTPEDQISTLNPEKFSSPLAISGGWKAGEPWLVRHISSWLNASSICKSKYIWWNSSVAGINQLCWSKNLHLHFRISNTNLSYTQVCYLQSLICGKQQVTRFDIFMNDTLTMKILQSKN